MQTDTPCTHDRVFDQGNRAGERGTRAVTWITAVMMVVEITAGWWFNSMALLADGWHMCSHTVAIGLSAIAYAAARRYARDSRFAFGTWKIEVLAGFASAIFLLGVAALMVASSLERIFTPRPIDFQAAIPIAAVGLVVNVVSALILGGADHHHDDHGQAGHHDLNLKSAYVHVLADAATSVFAIVALAGGWLYGWIWLDPVMGIVGAVVVAAWARSLVVATGKVLLDREMDHPVVAEIREAIESDRGATRIADLHVWRVSRNSYACALSILTHDPALTPEQVRQKLAPHPELVHSTIEIQQFP